MSNNTTLYEADISVYTATPFIYVSALVFGIIGGLGNMMVILVVLTTEKMRTLTNFMILNLAVADFFTSVLLIGNMFVIQAFSLRIPADLAGEIYCSLYNSAVFFWVSIKASTYNLVIMTFETYVAVVHPLLYPRYRTKRNIVASVIVSWLLGFILEVGLVGFHGNDKTGCYKFRYPTRQLSWDNIRVFALHCFLLYPHEFSHLRVL
ncbi:allatostatin-A receptor-like [Saccoglossus kowalevskii]|uniref:Tachykinin-like peptides receptor 86C-like n=1 Tax=Saccoglossus kowalevskii TaxID=10224 RepID=A0ABM0MQF4_SACKO|nr:PREDICTED: tachykinin-like peptides receptor 86C-like [Saccoglossus kowalevskii]